MHRPARRATVKFLPPLSEHTMDFTRRRLIRLAAVAVSSTPLLAYRPTALAARSEAPLQQARTAPVDIDPSGYLVSEKLDGVRAWWDGSRLRFRSGLPVIAPQWFTAKLPAGVALDGELWMGRGRFEDLSGAVRRYAALDAEWKQIRYALFDLPGAEGPFGYRAARLVSLAREARFEPLQAAPQRELADRRALTRWFDDVVQGGGEGLMLHRADAPWRAGRSDALLKLKPVDDAEAVVVAHIPGRGKHEGRVGALQVRTAAGVEFMLGTGLTDAQRQQPPALGSVVTFTYRGITGSGVPRFASFLRVRGA
jgi:DNA ligase 1